MINRFVIAVSITLLTNTAPKSAAIADQSISATQRSAAAIEASETFTIENGRLWLRGRVNHRACPLSIATGSRFAIMETGTSRTVKSEDPTLTSRLRFTQMDVPLPSFTGETEDARSVMLPVVFSGNERLLSMLVYHKPNGSGATFGLNYCWQFSSLSLDFPKRKVVFGLPVDDM
jgi:hypothetical protein